jgi:hypothetical protein
MYGPALYAAVLLVLGRGIGPDVGFIAPPRAATLLEWPAPPRRAGSRQRGRPPSGVAWLRQYCL